MLTVVVEREMRDSLDGGMGKIVESHRREEKVDTEPP